MYIILLLGAIVSASAFLESMWINFNCTSNQFACQNGRCISTKLRCDKKNDCGDASDEKECEMFLCEEPKFFRCKNKRCISKTFVCDEENDCEDFSDEVDCESFKISNHINSTCEKDHWQCTDKLCIPEEWVCNGEPDCLDGSDEVIGCSANIECDGFKCKNGHCVPNEWRCDGHEDCHDNSDEEDCKNHTPINECTLDNKRFLCANNRTCVDLNRACDGHPDCPDKSDESQLCTLQSLSCSKHGCTNQCVQLPTGPKCLCPFGYRNIDEKHCEDINECEQFDICDQKCRNTPGSYECYCEPKYILQENKKTCKVFGGEAMMVFSSKTEIRAYTLESELYFPVAKHLKQVVGVHYDGHHIHWTDIFSEHESIVRSIEDGSERELLVTSGLGLPEDLSVDWLTGNIYFTDVENKHIGVCTSDGSYCTVLLNQDIRKPRGIVLNVEDGDMYWTDWGEPAEIAYSLMDGSNDKSFVSNDIHWPNGLALDKPNERLYWTDAKKMTLESIKLDGTNRRIVLEGIVKHPYAIAVFEDKLYWSDWSTHSIQSCNKFSGKDHHTIVKEEREFIYGISIFHSALHQRTDNPCSLAFCSDICLLKGNSYTCACPQNKVLSNDKHICRVIAPAQKLIIGTRNTLIHVEHQILGKHFVTSIPTIVKDIGPLVYDSLHNVLFISDFNMKRIVSLNLDSGISKPLDIVGLGKITAMDYDPMGHNLYMCDEHKGILEVINLNTLSRKILLHSMNGEKPEAVALVPEEGVMFVALKRNGNQIAHIDRFYMDGTGRTHSIDDGLIGPISLHYDNDLNRIFIADAGTGNIESTSVEGDDRHDFRTLTTNPVGITSLKEQLFWVIKNSKRLYWADKRSETNINKKITLDLPEDPETLHIVSIIPKSFVSSPCHMNNNNCSHLCLISQKAIVCACPTGWDMSSDNHTCVKRAHCDTTEYLCSLSNTCILKSLRCNGHKDCTLGEDEMDCKMLKECSDGLFQCNNGECINEEQVCDHNYDCKDKSDEQNCDKKKKIRQCPPHHFICENGECISEGLLCNGISDCKDNSDEHNCQSRMCLYSQFRCDSGSCIPKSWECDQDFDCPDFSDEHAMCSYVTCLPTLYTCANGKCIDKKLICDGADDCGDNSDEHTCFVKTFEYCKQDEFPCSSNKSICLPNLAQCNGTSECPQGEDEKDCSNCMDMEFMCQNKKCIPVEWTCDKIDDCGDNSDEELDMCSSKNDSVVSPFTRFTHTSCENGFRCKMGDCIDLAVVCDGKHDCYDGSDEQGLCNVACEGMKNPCSQDCFKTSLGPMCRCKSGYKLMGDGYSCVDQDECQDDPPVCSQLCHNQEGGYKCDCFENFLLRSNKMSCKAVGLPVSLIFTTDGQIRELTQKTNQLSILFSAEMPKITGMDVVLKPKYIYFSVEAASSIHRIDLKSQTRHYIEQVGQPQKLAVDWSTNNVYYYNSNSHEKSVSVCNFDEMLCAKVINIDIHKQVSAIAVDPVNKVMFLALSSWWVFNSPTYTIFKYNLDGSGSQVLMKTTSGYITGLTFDHNKNDVYYADQHSRQIGMMNYEGKLKMVLFYNTTRSVGLRFFEDHLYYVTSGGYVTKCRLFNFRRCDNFKLHSYSSDLFAIVQDSLQPQIKNVCQNHTCSHLCIPSEFSFKCLCKNGTIESKTKGCISSEIYFSVKKNERLFVVHSVPISEEFSKKNTGVIVTAILVTLILLTVGTTLVYILRKKNSGRFNISMRFYNATYENQVDDEKPILQPGLHEYTNPVHFKNNEAELSTHSNKLN